MSQIVSVADIYEAITGARSYQPPSLPEKACLILARLSGDKLNSALVKAFVNAITFFPLGSVVRTTLDEVAVVVETNPADPLHPVLELLAEGNVPAGRLDSSRRDGSGAYARHIAGTLMPQGEALDMTKFLTAASG
jgi:hypothetical protein